jgi:hypothetical protein
MALHRNVGFAALMFAAMRRIFAQNLMGSGMGSFE